MEDCRAALAMTIFIRSFDKLRMTWNWWDEPPPYDFGTQRSAEIKYVPGIVFALACSVLTVKPYNNLLAFIGVTCEF